MNSKKLKSPIKFTKNDVRIISRIKCYDGFFSIIKYCFYHRRFNGKISDKIIREVFERGCSAVLLPYDPVQDKVVLIEQIRISAFDSSPTPWLLEMIAGIIEFGENPERVVRREALEEAGLNVKRIKKIVNYLSSPGGTSERLSLLVGEVDVRSAKGNYGLQEENEDIHVHVVNREQAYDWVEDGVIDNAASIIALQWLALHHKKLQVEWNLR